mgnify:CR=1 FL=1
MAHNKYILLFSIILTLTLKNNKKLTPSICFKSSGGGQENSTKIAPVALQSIKNQTSSEYNSPLHIL